MVGLSPLPHEDRALALLPRGEAHLGSSSASLVHLSVTAEGPKELDGLQLPTVLCGARERAEI